MKFTDREGHYGQSNVIKSDETKSLSMHSIPELLSKSRVQQTKRHHLNLISVHYSRSGFSCDPCLLMITRRNSYIQYSRTSYQHLRCPFRSQAVAHVNKRFLHGFIPDDFSMRSPMMAWEWVGLVAASLSSYFLLSSSVRSSLFYPDPQRTESDQARGSDFYRY